MNTPQFTIFINARPSYITDRMLTRDQVVQLAGFDWRSTDIDTDQLTVTYCPRWNSVYAPLSASQSLPVTEGMKINVYTKPDHRNFSITLEA